jgi:hypothetical protein
MIQRTHLLNPEPDLYSGVSVQAEACLQLFAVQQARSVFFCFGKFSQEQLP